MAKWCDRLIDLVWPRISRATTYEQVQEKAAAQHRRDIAMMSIRSLSSAEEASQARASLERLAEAERDRQASVEERLRALVPLATVAAALVLGIGLPSADSGVGASRTLFALAALYAVAQLLLALRASVAGLGRRSYRALTPEDLFPQPEEQPVDREKRLSELWYDVMADLQETANRKVERMAVAHQALLNFVYAVMLATLAAAVARLA